MFELLNDVQISRFSSKRSLFSIIARLELLDEAEISQLAIFTIVIIGRIDYISMAI